MSLEKFYDMLNTNTLFFCRADRFSDPFEGSLTQIEHGYRKNQGNDDGFSETHKEMKKFTLINCWQISDYESDAMWRLYLKSNEGVAIRSTSSKLSMVLEKNPNDFYLSKVRYIDYEQDRWYHEIDYPVRNYNLFIPLTHKRIEFTSENELRIIHDIEYQQRKEDYWQQQPNDKGKKLEIDIKELIDEIVLPPTADTEVEKKIKAILDKFNLDIPIRKSSLSNEPLY